jgi:type I restriction enzyme S subunit
MISPVSSGRGAGPRSWKWVPLKFAAAINSHVLPENTDPNFRFRYIDIASVGQDGSIGELPEFRFEDAPSRARRRVAAGDVVVSTVRTYLRAIARVPARDEPLICSTGFATLRARTVEPRYLYWWARSSPFVEEVVARSVGVGYPAISPFDLGRIPTPVPPVEEQLAIANFLDREIARLDSLVTARSQMLALSEERFETVVEHELGIGLYPQERLGRVADGVTVGVVVNPSTYVVEDGPVLYFRGVDVRPFELDVTGAQRMSLESSRFLEKSMLRSGDIVCVRVGEPGVAAVVPAEADGANCASLLIVRGSKRFHSDYLCYVFNSRFGRGQFRALAQGAAQLQVNATDAVDFSVPMPSLETQGRIAESLDRRRQTLNLLRVAVGNQVASLRARRQVLITSAVSGQTRQ